MSKRNRHRPKLKFAQPKPNITKEPEGWCAKCQQPVHEEWILDPDGYWHIQCYPPSRSINNVIDLKQYQKEQDEASRIATYNPASFDGMQQQ